MQSRMTVKKELKAIAQSNNGIDKQEYDYFMDNIKHIGFTDREIGYLIFDLLYGYWFQKDDYELKIADFLFNQTSNRSHPRFNDLFIDSFFDYSIVTFELLLRNNVTIEETVIENIEMHLEDIELGFNSITIEKINILRNRLNTLKQYARKQKIEKIRNETRTKSKMINNRIISPLLLSKSN